MYTISTTPGHLSNGYRAAVATILEQPDTKVSKQYQQILAGMDHALAAADVNTGPDTFISAVLAGDETTIRDAMREWQLQRNQGGSLLRDADHAIAAALRTEYAATAKANYEAIRRAFNLKSAELLAAASAVDLSQPADQILLAPDKQRRAWSEAATLSARLDQLADLLELAARLAKLDYLSDGHTGNIAALTIDRESLNDPATWEALEASTHRAGRWSHLTALGVDVTAHAATDVRPVNRPTVKVDWEPGTHGYRRVESIVATN